jgi:two-component system sensor histidine kinase HydH
VTTSSRWKMIWPFILLGVSFGVLGLVTALSLLSQQATFSGVMRESVASQRAAVEFEECVFDVVALLNDRVESVEALHGRLRGHAGEVRRHADQAEEQTIVIQLDEALMEYQRRWREMPPPGKPGHEAAVQQIIRFLDRQLVRPCQEFEAFNTRRIEQAAADHQSGLKRLAWGMAGVAGLATTMGLLLGFALTRGLRRSFRRLAVQIHDAAGKIGDAPHILVTEESDVQELHDQVDRLSARIEAVVQELQQRQREVLRAEQLAAVGQLAAGVAHEIRNPLTSIKMLVQAGLEDGALPAEDLRVMEPEVRRMERSLRTFLDFARPPRPERRPTSLNEVVQHTVGLIQGRAAKQRVEVSTDLPPEGVWLIGDGQQLEQVLINLTLNSLDVMPSGGALKVSLRSTPTEAVIEVADVGPGLSPEVLDRLFHPFVSSKPTGLGLGLVICRRIVEDHGGTVNAANGPNGGAVFTVRLPRTEDDACRPC